MKTSIYEDMTNSEKEVAAYLTKKRVWWQFEQAVYVKDDKERPRVWTPDFYLPELGIYIEVCGHEKFDYSFRRKVYDKNKIPVIFIHKFKSKKEWEPYLIDNIKRINEKRSKIIERL